MISVILYGRNDSHGYNLHKRAAISLNCIAHVLSDPDDEIIFVDYNTPDDLPTFPEAIQDTLSEKAKALTRVIRVRPEHHRRYASRTHLVALEPIARNVALRRSNPANRWVLSTNTDMVFAPLPGFASLTEGVSTFADGFYHLPRFELPEALWESLDRSDAERIIEQVRSWSSRFHLNEVVYGSPDILFDGPGDFQLALRSDLLAIDGFHEDMLLGWHVDSNLAKRMRIHRGEIKSALGIVRGFHCDHTRQATVLHKRDRAQNDSGLYVERVTEPSLPKQRGHFGLADVELEELRVGRASTRYVNALSTVLTTPAGTDYTASYVSASYGQQDYDPRHILPYLLDLLSSAPPGARIGYVGVREDTARLLADALSDFDPSLQLRLPAAMGTSAPPGATTVDVAAWLSGSDLYIFEVNTPTPSDHSDAIGARRAVLQLFQRLVQYERPEPARVIAVNAIHNDFEQQVSASVSVTATPFSSRIRHGYIARTGGDAAVSEPTLLELGKQLSLATSRARVAPKSEVERLLELAKTLRPASADGGDLRRSEAFRHRTSLTALLALPGIGMRLAWTPTEVEAAKHALGTLPKANEPASAREGFRGRTGSRLADVDDWEDAGFLAWAERFGPMDAYSIFNRTAWLWQRLAMVLDLERNGLLADTQGSAAPRILLLGHPMDPLGSWLETLGLAVDHGPADGAGNASASYDALLCLDTSALVGEGQGRDNLAKAIGQVRTGGLVMVDFTARLDTGLDRGSIAIWLAEQVDQRLAEACGCEGEPGDWTLTGATAERRSTEGLHQDIFVHDFWGHRTVGMFSWRRSTGPVNSGEIDRVLRWRPLGLLGTTYFLALQTSSWAFRRIGARLNNRRLS